MRLVLCKDGRCPIEPPSQAFSSQHDYQLHSKPPMITNPHSPASITPAALASLDAGITAMRTGCAELPTADAALLRRAAKMGLKTETFSREAIELARQNPQLCPAGLDLEHAERAMAVRDALLSRYLQARQLAETLEVAMQVCGVDAFDAARTAYKSMKANCRDAALLELINHLGKTFRSRRSEKIDAPEPSAPVDKPTVSGLNEPTRAEDQPIKRASGGPAAAHRTSMHLDSAPEQPSSQRSKPPMNARVLVRQGLHPNVAHVRPRIYWQTSAAPYSPSSVRDGGVRLLRNAGRGRQID